MNYKGKLYKGKLYGKVGNKYFDTGYTSDDLPAPEPLDPHTCKLCVGDLVEYKGVNNIIVSITPKCANAPTLYELIDRAPNNIVKGRKSILIMRRKLLKLTHRNGATIKEACKKELT